MPKVKNELIRLQIEVGPFHHQLIRFLRQVGQCVAGLGNEASNSAVVMLAVEQLAERHMLPDDFAALKRECQMMRRLE